jgi:iron complex outermembrane receptor protein
MVVIKEKEITPEIVVASTPPPPVTINGKVTNDKGEPLSGSTVTEKGTTNATTAKDDGSFSLTVASEKSVLVISYVGFDAQEIVVGNKNTVAVRLVQRAAALTDVVVVGYGKANRAKPYQCSIYYYIKGY